MSQHGMYYHYSKDWTCTKCHQDILVCYWIPGAKLETFRVPCFQFHFGNPPS